MGFAFKILDRLVHLLTGRGVLRVHELFRPGAGATPHRTWMIGVHPSSSPGGPSPWRAQAWTPNESSCSAIRPSAKRKRARTSLWTGLPVCVNVYSFEPTLFAWDLEVRGLSPASGTRATSHGREGGVPRVWCGQKRRPRCQARAMVHDTVIEPYVHCVAVGREFVGSRQSRHVGRRSSRRTGITHAFKRHSVPPDFADGLGVRVRRVGESRRALARAAIEGDRKYLAEPDVLGNDAGRKCPLTSDGTRSRR
jgi:hypothetical protein